MSGSHPPPTPRKRRSLFQLRRTRPSSDIDDQTNANKKSFRRFMNPVKSQCKSLISRAFHRGSRSKSRATPNQSVHRSSQGSNGIDRGSNVFDGATDIPGQLPELDKNEFLGAEQTGRSTWAREMIDEFSTCTGDREPEWYAAARKELKLDE
jgi:hypothetical protein